MHIPASSPTAPQRTHYQWVVFDSARWDSVALRPDDIVISTPIKCGTTWMQMICALLVLGTADLPAPLSVLSPELELITKPIDEVVAGLEAQRHRRFIKSHTPLDGMPTAAGVTYVVVGRDPRDAAVSMDHFYANMDPDVVQRHLAKIGKEHALDDHSALKGADDQRSRILRWVLSDDLPEANLQTLRGLVHHLADAWQRRDDPNVVLLHYADLSRDLAGQMRWLAGRLGIEVGEDMWPELVEAATFGRMRASATNLLPGGVADLFVDQEKFFHSGTSGQWRDVLTEDDLAVYEQRLAELAPPDLVHWLHHGANHGTDNRVSKGQP